MVEVSEYLTRAGNSAHSYNSQVDDVAGYRAARSYRWHRSQGYRAPEALQRARADAAKETDRPGVYRGPLWGGAMETGARWCEDTRAAGLRFVGFADEIDGSHVDHTGWFLQSDGWGEAARGAVYLLPGKGGRSRYVPALRTGQDTREGWRDMDDGALIYLGDTVEGCPLEGGVYRSGRRVTGFYASPDKELREAARAADRHAESYAESERDYTAAWQAGARMADLESEAAESREAARSLIRELRTLARSIAPGTAPAACAALRASVRERLEEWREARREAKELRETYGAARIFGESTLYVGEDNPLRQAFADGADLAESAR